MAHPLCLNIIMKKLTAFFLGCFLLTILSCREKPREVKIQEFQATLNASDTTMMLKLADDAMEMLKSKDINGVLGMLYEYNDSTKEAKPISVETAERYRNLFSMFPVLDYYRIYYSFQLEGCNDVKYRVVFCQKDSSDTGEEATTAYMFNPVKVDGEWKLCVKTASEQIDTNMR